MIFADGAVWIWNLAEDRFPQARQQLDLFHAKQHWTVAHELHGSGCAGNSLSGTLKQLEKRQAPRVIYRLEEMLIELSESQAKVVGREMEYFKTTSTAWIIERRKKRRTL